MAEFVDEHSFFQAFLMLPDPLLDQIVTHFDYLDFVSVGLSCRRLYEILFATSLRRRLYERLDLCLESIEGKYYSHPMVTFHDFDEIRIKRNGLSFSVRFRLRYYKEEEDWSVQYSYGECGVNVYESLLSFSAVIPFSSFIRSDFKTFRTRLVNGTWTFHSGGCTEAYVDRNGTFTVSSLLLSLCESYQVIQEEEENEADDNEALVARLEEEWEREGDLIKRLMQGEDIDEEEDDAEMERLQKEQDDEVLGLTPLEKVWGPPGSTRVLKATIERSEIQGNGMSTKHLLRCLERCEFESSQEGKKPRKRSTFFLFSEE